MISKYQPNQLNAVLDIYIDNFTNPPFQYEWIVPEKIERYLTDLYRTPNFRGYLFEHDSEIVGFCFGVLNDYFAVDFYDIKEIIIRRDKQGQGFGSLFLADLESTLSESGVQAITLLTDKQLRAFDFYKKNGFVLSDTSVFFSKFLSR